MNYYKGLDKSKMTITKRQYPLPNSLKNLSVKKLNELKEKIFMVASETDLIADIYDDLNGCMIIIEFPPYVKITPDKEKAIERIITIFNRTTMAWGC